METSIKQILRDHFADGVHHSHVSMIEPKGRYQFGRQDFEKFVTRYCEVIMTQEDPILGVAEKPQHYLPVLVDVDIKIELEDEEEVNFVDHIYNEDQVKQVVEVYQSVLRKIVEECSDENLKCILLEKDIYYLNVEDGLIIFYVLYSFFDISFVLLMKIYIHNHYINYILYNLIILSKFY